ANLSGQLSASVTPELAAAQRYLETRDSVAERDFKRYGWDAHRAQRALNQLNGASTEEVSLLASADEQLARIEIKYALAHRLTDLGRKNDAQREASTARAMVNELLAEVQQLTNLKAQQVAAASTRLRSDVAQRGGWMLTAMAAAVLLALLIVYGTVSRIARPLRGLVGHARALSDGNFTARTTDDLPG